MGLIVFNYGKAMRQAERLQEIARKVQAVGDGDMEVALANVNRSWNGENASEFIKKGHKLAEDTKAMGKDLEKIAETIREIARQIEAAEQAAKALL